MPNNNGNPDLRFKTGNPLPSVDDVEKNILDVFKDFSFSDFKFQRIRCFSFKNILYILLVSVLRNFFNIADICRNISGKSVYNISLSKFSKQALFQKLRSINPEWFKKVLFYFSDNTCVRNSNIDIHRNKIRSFNRFLKVDLSRLDRCPNNKFAIKSDSINFNKYYSKLGGAILTCTNLLNEKLCYIHYNRRASNNDLSFKDILYSWFKKNDLVCFDKGYNSYEFFNTLNDKGVYFIQPLYKSTKYKVVKVMYRDNSICDSLIRLSGRKKVKSVMRLVSVKIGKATYYYITNVTDINRLNAKDIYLLYEKRWNIEKTFNYVKRTLNLSYLWSADPNIIEIQVYITFIIYLSFLNMIGDVSKLLDVEPQRISFHMVKKALFTYSQNYKDYNSFLQFLVDNHKSLELIKPIRKYQKEKQEKVYLAFCESLL